MDYKKIGEFISRERKTKKLTQVKLAEKLYVSEKTISKWEQGNGIPDTSVLPKLCEVLEISVNELLKGERISEQDYKNNAERQLVELAKQNELKNRKIYLSTWVIVLILSVFYLGVVLFAGLMLQNDLVVGLIMCISTIILAIGLYCVFKQEMDMSYYVCKNCEHRFTPTYKEALFACHMPKSKHLECPKCGKKTWAKREMTK